MTLKHGVILIVCVGIAFAAGMGLSLQQGRSTVQEERISGLLWPNPKQLTPFSLVDQHGAEFGLERLRGKWSFLFFGYTSCPDICPTTMSVLSRVKSQLAQEFGDEAMQFILVSVDPERDTQDRMRSYVEYFDPEFIGLRAPEARLDELTSQLGILHVRVGEAGSDDYLIDHSASILLISPKLELVGLFSAPHESVDIAARAASIIKYVNAHS